MRTLIFSLAAVAIALSPVQAGYEETLSAGSYLSDSARADLGDIREVNTQAFQPTFRSSFRADGTFTSNARLQGSHSSSDLIFQPTLEAGMNIPLGQGFDFDLVGRIENATYADHGSRSFFGASGGATLTYRLATRLPRFYIGAEPYWYGRMDGDRLSSALALTAGTDHDWTFNRGRTVAFGGYQFSRYYAAPSRDDRDAHQVLVGVTHQLRDRLFIQPFYSIRYEDFSTRDRSDVRHAFGTSLLYQFTENIFGNMTGTYLHNASSDDLFDYTSAGLTLGVTVQF